MLVEFGVAMWLASMASQRAVHMDLPAHVQLAESIGLSADALATAGMPVEGAQAALARLGEAQNLTAALRQSQGAASQAANRVTELLELLRSDPGNPELAGELRVREAELEAANEGILAGEAALVTDALRDAQPETVAAIERFRSHPGRGLPGAFRATSLSAEESDAIQAALVAERRAARLGRELPVELSQLLVDVRQRQEVAQAAQRLETLLPLLREAFAQAGPPQ